MIAVHKTVEQSSIELLSKKNLEFKVFNSLNELSTDKIKYLLIRTQTKISEEILKQFVSLKGVVTCTSGFDHIDWRAAKSLNIVVAHSPESQIVSTSELTLLHILTLLRKIRLNEASTWKNEFSPGNTLKGKSVGIIGLGQIGSNLASVLKTMGAIVSFYDPYVFNDKYKKVDLSSEVFNNDIISFHCPLTQETKELYKDIPITGRSKIIINCARGELLPLNFIKKNSLHFYGLDVFETEPLANDSFIRSQKENISFSHHIGAYTQEALKNSCLEGTHQLLEIMANKNPKSLVPNSLKWLQA